MKSPTTSADKGFTLIELLLVVGLVSMTLAFGLFFDFDNFRAYSFHSDRDTLLSALQHARAQAVSNICRGACEGGRPHGVKIQNNKYIIFQGDSWSTADHTYDAVLDASPNVARGGVEEVVFTQLSGDATTSDTSADCVTEPICITLESTHRESIITINEEGQILWTN